MNYNNNDNSPLFCGCRSGPVCRAKHIALGRRQEWAVLSVLSHDLGWGCASRFVVYKRTAGYPFPNRDLRYYGGKPVLTWDRLQVGCRLARSTANHKSSPSPSLLGTTILDSLGKLRVQRSGPGLQPSRTYAQTAAQLQQLTLSWQPGSDASWSPPAAIRRVRSG